MNLARLLSAKNDYKNGKATCSFNQHWHIPYVHSSWSDVVMFINTRDLLEKNTCIRGLQSWVRLLKYEKKMKPIKMKKSQVKLIHVSVIIPSMCAIMCLGRVSVSK